MKYVCACVFSFVVVSVLFSQERDQSLGRGSVMPSYFVASEHPWGENETGLKSPVVAFAITSLGRVSFTATGAAVAVTIPNRHRTADLGAGEPIIGNNDGLNRHETMVVLRVGMVADLTKWSPVRPRLAELNAFKVNYFVGSSESWRSGLQTYQKLIYKEMWHGVSVEYLATGKGLGMQLVLEPEADPHAIQFETGAAHHITMADGDLSAQLAGAELVFSALQAFQTIAGVDKPVEVRFDEKGHGGLGIQLGDYHPDLPVVVRMGVGWTTYVGGPGGYSPEEATAMEVDSSGSVYLTGVTQATDFPTTSGTYVYQGASYDFFVSKFSSKDHSLIYSTLIGGTGDDRSMDLALDASGRVVVVGRTSSHDFPITVNAFDSAINGSSDAFVVGLSPDGTTVEKSTFLGGSSYDAANCVALDAQSRIVVAGYTGSGDFPTSVGAYDSDYSGGTDGFVSILDSNATQLVRSTFLGGANRDYVEALDLDVSGNAYVIGPAPDGFPTTVGAYDTSANGGDDLFVCKLNGDLSVLDYSTYLGGTSVDVGSAIVVDAQGCALVCGATGSTDYPTTPLAFDVTHNGLDDAFLTKLDASGSSLVYSTFFGSEFADRSFGVDLDELGHAFLAGFTDGLGFPVTPGSYQSSLLDGGSVFVLKLNDDGTALDYASLLGGSKYEEPVDIQFEDEGVYVFGTTWSRDFAITVDAFDQTLDGSEDLFLSILMPDFSSLSYSTYLGGSGPDDAVGVGIDSSGNILVVGNTASAAFPTTAGAFSVGHSGYCDAFVFGLSSDGNQLQFATFLGGSEADVATDAAFDSNGNVYVTGFTNSSDFPTTLGSFNESHSGSTDAFVVKLSSDGSSLEFATFLGSPDSDLGRAIEVDDLGSTFVAGGTAPNSSFPTTSGAFGAVGDVFLSKLTADGSSLDYSTRMGSSFSQSTVMGVAVDQLGQAVLVGGTQADDFPTTAGAFNENYNGGSFDVFVSKYNDSGSGLIYSTFVGNYDEDYATAVTVDALGCAYVTGYSWLDYPATPGAYDGFCEFDTFVTKLNPTGTSLVYSTMIGPDFKSEYGANIQVDESGRAYVIGQTDSSVFPTTTAIAEGFGNLVDGDVFVSVVNEDGTDLEFSAVIGGSHADFGRDLVLDELGNIVIVGTTRSSDLMTTAGVYDETMNGVSDVFVSLIDLCSPLISAQPLGATLCSGDAAYFSVASSGLSELSYQWYLNGLPIAVATSSNYEIAAAQASDAGVYTCIVSSDCGYIESAGATLSILDPNALVEHWSQPLSGDPTGDGWVDVRDLTYMGPGLVWCW